jgi:hypothetical protein
MDSLLLSKRHYIMHTEKKGGKQLAKSRQKLAKNQSSKSIKMLAKTNKFVL